MDTEIYLDANATSAVLPAAIDAALAVMREHFGNPSSSHAAGLRARRVLDDARERARRVLGAGSGHVVFTSGATEGIQTAVLSALRAVRARQQAGQPCGGRLVGIRPLVGPATVLCAGNDGVVRCRHSCVR